MRGSRKADVSVDSVHTPFGRTNESRTAPVTSKRAPQEQFRSKVGQVMSYPQPRTMNRCRPPRPTR